MSIELRVERLIDAPPVTVFDVFVDPDLQGEIHREQRTGLGGVEGRDQHSRSGGTSVYHMGKRGSEPDKELRVYSGGQSAAPTRVHAPDGRGRLGYPGSRQRWTVTFEEQDGKTLVRMVQTGFESAEIRDGFMEGWPEYLKTLERVVGDQLKARHDTDG